MRPRWTGYPQWLHHQYCKQTGEAAIATSKSHQGSSSLLRRLQELTRDLYIKHPAPMPAASKATPRTPRKGSSGGAAGSAADAGGARGSRSDADAASMPDQRTGCGVAAAVASAGGAANASVRCRAVALAHALDAVGAVKVSSDRVVLPAEYLRAALQQCLLLQLNEMVVSTEVVWRGARVVSAAYQGLAVRLVAAVQHNVGRNP